MKEFMSVCLFVCVFYFEIFLYRLFLTMNPKYGEISRAMRNRGVEMFILPEVVTYFPVLCSYFLFGRINWIVMM